MRAQRFTVRIYALLLALATHATAALSPELDRALKESKYVYVQSERKAGDLGKSAEIWYFYDAGTVYVASPPTAWRVRRIKAGRRKARIAVGKPDGPSFAAAGRTLHDGAIEERLLAAFSRQYPERSRRVSPSPAATSSPASPTIWVAWASRCSTGRSATSSVASSRRTRAGTT